MKKHLIIFLLPILMFSCYSSGKYVADFRFIKKRIDTLIYIPAIVDISAFHVDGNLIFDSDRSDEIQRLIDKSVRNTMPKKYCIISDALKIDLKSPINTAIQELLNKLRVKRHPIDSVLVPKIIIDATSQYKNEYFLFLAFRGRYSLYNNDYNTAIPSGSEPITFNKHNMILDMVLFDRKRQLVLYFDELLLVDDPRDNPRLDNMLTQILRKLK
jgi:hypothetical protein